MYLKVRIGQKRPLAQPDLVFTKAKQVVAAAVAAPTKAAVATRAVETTPSKKGNTAKKTVVQDQKKKPVKAKNVSTAVAYDVNAKAYKKRNAEVSRGLTMKQWTNGGRDWEFEIERIVINDYNQCNQYKKYKL